MKVILGFEGKLVKICPKCWRAVEGTWRELAQAFGQNRDRSDGFQVHCKDCRNTHRRKRR